MRSVDEAANNGCNYTEGDEPAAAEVQHGQKIEHSRHGLVSWRGHGLAHATARASGVSTERGGGSLIALGGTSSATVGRIARASIFDPRAARVTVLESRPRERAIPRGMFYGRRSH
jgi:hypothetical protein